MINEITYAQMADQYEDTAHRIYSRISELKHYRAEHPFDDKNRTEERIAILESEYQHLLKTAHYIREHYAEVVTPMASVI